MDTSQFLTAQIEGMEWIIILVIIAVLFLFGPQKLPEMARSFGRAVGEFRKARMQIDREISEEYKGVKESVDKIEAELKGK